jgi:FlaA1/EpsC-like NDP-sugar epimerase
MLEYLFSSPRPIKRIISVAYDTLSVLIVLMVAVALEGQELTPVSFDSAILALSVLVGSLLAFVRLGLYRAIIRFMGHKAILSVITGVAVSSVGFAFLHWLIYEKVSVAQVSLYWSLLLLLVGGARLVVLSYLRSYGSEQGKQPVAIYGAGAAGRQLASALLHGNKYRPVAFIDDDVSLINNEIDGLKVYSPVALNELIREKTVKVVLLAIPSASHAVRSGILARLEPFPVKVKTIAAMEEIVSGKVKIEQVKDIDVEDLLGRDPVKPDDELLYASVRNKVVLVTGAGGSIGSELCRQIVRLKPKVLVLYELSEYALYSINKELEQAKQVVEGGVKLVPLLGSVQHKNRIFSAMKMYGVNTVYHAAAYKHVPIVENNIVEGIRNNVFGTWFAAEAAIAAKVERFVLISTDKAVRPTNVMGASKRLAEMVLQALDQRGSETTFSMVRFGNVLGSSGSVVPLFRQQIKRGGPVTVTHKEIIRYFMTIPEAAQLVLQAGSMGQGGDVFVLDMGEPVKIVELAERIIHLMGMSVKSPENPQGDIEIQFTGLRPGEKLYEELLIGDNVSGTRHPKIMTACEESLSWEQMNHVLKELDDFCLAMDCEAIVQLLLRLPVGYAPQNAVCDLLWDKDRNTGKVIRFKTLS